jgi:hypothetical protein
MIVVHSDLVSAAFSRGSIAIFNRSEQLRAFQYYLAAEKAVYPIIHHRNLQRWASLRAARSV